MILLGLILVAFLLVAGWRRLERFAYLKMGEEYEREAARRREWKVGIPYDPSERPER